MKLCSPLSSRALQAEARLQLEVLIGTKKGSEVAVSLIEIVI
jgi:hypothetical protein